MTNEWHLARYMFNGTHKWIYTHTYIQGNGKRCELFRTCDKVREGCSTEIEGIFIRIKEVKQRYLISIFLISIDIQFNTI